MKTNNFSGRSVFVFFKNSMVVLACIMLFQACTAPTPPAAFSYSEETPAVPEKTHLTTLPQAVTAKAIVAQYKRAQLHKRKTIRHVASVAGTSKTDLLLVKDSILFIGVEDGDRPYVILGHTMVDTGFSNQAVKCSFSFKDIKVLHSLKLGQVVTLASNNYEPCYMANTKENLLVEMGFCKLIKD